MIRCDFKAALGFAREGRVVLAHGLRTDLEIASARPQVGDVEGRKEGGREEGGGGGGGGFKRGERLKSFWLFATEK
jgi:hypothetical protein